eukprot:gene6938-7598_t
MATSSPQEELRDFSLKDLVQNNIRDNVINAVQTNKDEWKVLIVDDKALHALSSVYRMSEVIKEGITVVESISKRRKPIKDFHALYLCLPTEENIDFIVNDIVPTPLYKAVHVFFMTACSKDLLAKLARKRIMSQIKTLKEVSLYFRPVEARVFTIDRPNGMYECYSPYANPLDVDSISTQLLTLCESLKEVPIVRCASNNDSNWLQKHKRPSQLLILDRSFDLMSPLAHELTYQAASMDLLDIENNIYSFDFRDGAGRTSRKQITLDETDDLWVQFRHYHISEVFQQVSQQFKTFSESAKHMQGLPSGE